MLKNRIRIKIEKQKLTHFSLIGSALRYCEALARRQSIL